MYDVVADIERYPEFLPLCEALVIRSRTEKGDATEIIATMTVGYKAIRESFTTRVTLEPEGPRIIVENLDGPFSHLENIWRFTPAAEGSDVHFEISYTFRSTLLSMLVGAAFDNAVRRYTEAFEARARALYGPRTPVS
jgi:coenzyme Q-binding protein COQ10